MHNKKHKCTYVCINIYLYLYTYIHIYIHTPIYMYISIHIYICTFIDIYLHVNIHEYIHIYIHVYTWQFLICFETYSCTWQFLMWGTSPQQRESPSARARLWEAPSNGARPRAPIHESRTNCPRELIRKSPSARAPPIVLDNPTVFPWRAPRQTRIATCTKKKDSFIRWPQCKCHEHILGAIQH